MNAPGESGGGGAARPARPARPLRIFNLDLHISVIADARAMLEELGHSVTSWNLSGHTWVFGQQPAKVDVVSAENWKRIGRQTCGDFHARYKDELAGFDAFLVTYPPAFALLFEKFGKPIIIQAPIRYEVPFGHRPADWRAFNDFLRRGIDEGRIVAIGNSRYECAYAEYFLERPWQHIPNLCAYTGVTYAPSRPEFLYYSRYADYRARLGGQAIPNLVTKERALGAKHTWADLVRCRGIVAIPYNVSTMSIFEHYAQGMPMWFPDQGLMTQLRMGAPGQVLAEMSWNQTFRLPPGSTIKPGPNDPNNYTDLGVFIRWLPLADFYDRSWMPHLQYFTSFQELRDRLATVRNDELSAISARMLAFGKERKAKILDLWRGVAARVGDALGSSR
jgi:hypothetical protein